MMFLLRFLDHQIFIAQYLFLFLWISVCFRCRLVMLAIQLLFSANVPEKTIHEDVTYIQISQINDRIYQYNV